MNMQEYMKERVDNQIQWYDQKSVKAQKYYKRYQVVEIVLAALIPLLVGYAEFPLVPFIIGVFGVMIAVIESVTKLYKFHENWIEYRTTAELLRFQKHLYLTNCAPYNEKEETIDNLFVKNVESIISSENNQWKTLNTLEERKAPK